MYAAPKIYDEEFYRRELDGQKKRLNNLKSRQENRRMRFEKIIKNPVSVSQHKTDAATTTAAKFSKPPSRSQDLETAVLHALESSTLELPCTLDAFVDRLESKPHHGDVAAILRSKSRRKEHSRDNEKDESGSVTVELKNPDNTKKMIITAVHFRKKEETPSKKQKRNQVES
jgi:hypothetical protein